MNWDVNKKKENEKGVKVELRLFAERNELNILCGDPTKQIVLKTNNVNRPGLLLAGFEDYFATERVQVMGNAETYFLSRMEDPDAKRVTNQLFSKKPPCVIITRGIAPDEYFLACASAYGVPVLTTEMATTLLISELTTYLKGQLAESVSVHGTLMEVSGVGVLITGDSGMGKSETALELVHRGHKLVADDAVIAKNMGNSIIGTSPESIRFFMEVRGIGIIDVRELFGVGSVLYDYPIDLVIKLEDWKSDAESERFLYEAQYEDILGVKVPRHIMPVMAGRNLAIVVEVAARNHRLKLMGIDATANLISRQNFDKK